MMKYTNLFSAFAALVVSGFAMGESARIELKWQEGKTYYNRQNIGMVMDMGAMKTKTNMQMETKGKVKAHERGVGVATSIQRVKMDAAVAGQDMSYDSNKKEGNNPELAREMSKILKVTYTAVYSKTGKFVRVEDLPAEVKDLEGMDQKSLESNLRQQSALLPNKEVKVGDTWQANVSSPLPGMDKDLNIKFDVKLDKIVEEGGRKLAKLSYSGKMEKTEVVQQGQAMTIEASEISGTMDFDVNLGQVYKSDMGMDLSVKAQAGITVNMNMNAASELFKVEG